MKIFRNKIVLCAVLWACLLVLIAAGKPGGITGLTSLWVGDQTVTADETPGENDVFIAGTLEVDGATRLDGNVDVNADLDISGTFTNANTRSFALQLAAGGVDGGDDVDGTSTPDLSSEDGIPAIVWADSSETTAVGWTFRLPSDFASDLVVYALVSSNSASGAGQKLDWAVFVNLDGTSFDGTEFSQAAVECTSPTLNASNEVLTLTSDATAENAYVAGSWITLEFFNASTDDDDLELKGLDVTYTATR